MAKKKHIRAIFDNVNNLSIDDIAKSKALKDLLKSQVPVAIIEANSSNKQCAILFEINDSDHFVEIPKKDWIQALETCIMWYLETEEYEKCTKIKAVIEDIQKKPVKKINVKNS